MSTGLAKLIIILPIFVILVSGCTSDSPSSEIPISQVGDLVIDSLKEASPEFRLYINTYPNSIINLTIYNQLNLANGILDKIRNDCENSSIDVDSAYKFVVKAEGATENLVAWTVKKVPLHTLVKSDVLCRPFIIDASVSVTELPGSECTEGSAPIPCGPTEEGVCEFGEQLCEDGVWSDCTGYVGPETEDELSDPIYNDGEDNDCDGEVDEGFLCSEGANSPCGSNVGLCKPGIKFCVDGEWGECEDTENTVKPVAEVCNDDKDNDCDSLVDCDDDACTTNSACSEAMCGDLNGNGNIDVSDITSLWQLIRLNQPPTDITDINGDSLLNNDDGNLLSGHLGNPDDYPIYCGDEPADPTVSCGDVNEDNKRDKDDVDMLAGIIFKDEASGGAIIDLDGDGEVTLLDLSVLIYNTYTEGYAPTCTEGTEICENGECEKNHTAEKNACGNMDADLDIDNLDVFVLGNAVFFGGSLEIPGTGPPAAAFSDTTTHFQNQATPDTANGDLNDDNVIDALDLAVLIDYVYGSGNAPTCEPPIVVSCGDANGDGQVNVKDLRDLNNYLFSAGTLEGNGDADGDGFVTPFDLKPLIISVNGGAAPTCTGGICQTLSCGSTTKNVDQFTCGNINKNTKIDMIDIGFLTSKLIENTGVIDKAVGDLNGDDAITFDDLYILIDYFYGRTSAPTCNIPDPNANNAPKIVSFTGPATVDAYIDSGKGTWTFIVSDEDNEDLTASIDWDEPSKDPEVFYFVQSNVPKTVQHEYGFYSPESINDRNVVLTVTDGKESVSLGRHTQVTLTMPNQPDDPEPSADIQVIKPEGGEVLYIGDLFSIQWTAPTEVDKIWIRLISKNSDNVVTSSNLLSEGHPSYGGGNFNWLVSGGGNQIKITSSSSTYKGESNKFTILPKWDASFAKDVRITIDSDTAGVFNSIPSDGSDPVKVGSHVRNDRGVITGDPLYFPRSITTLSPGWLWNVNFDDGIDGWVHESPLALETAPKQPPLAIHPESLLNPTSVYVGKPYTWSIQTNVPECLSYDGGTITYKITWEAGTQSETIADDTFCHLEKAVEHTYDTDGIKEITLTATNELGETAEKRLGINSLYEQLRIIDFRVHRVIDEKPTEWYVKATGGAPGPLKFTVSWNDGTANTIYTQGQADVIWIPSHTYQEVGNWNPHLVIEDTKGQKDEKDLYNPASITPPTIEWVESPLNGEVVNPRTNLVSATWKARIKDPESKNIWYRVVWGDNSADTVSRSSGLSSGQIHTISHAYGEPDYTGLSGETNPGPNQYTLKLIVDDGSWYNTSTQSIKVYSYAQVESTRFNADDPLKNKAKTTSTAPLFKNPPQGDSANSFASTSRRVDITGGPVLGHYGGQECWFYEFQYQADSGYFGGGWICEGNLFPI
ncbi:MAG: dockerin type I domain-containing protein [Candidatus Aenigmatarchaeota archaeon]